MQGIRLEPAQSLLQNFGRAELTKLARMADLRVPAYRSRAQFINAITSHLDTDEIVDALLRLFPKTSARRPGREAKGRRPESHSLRLDALPPLHGAVTVQAYAHARPALGQVLLGFGDRCLTLGLNNAPLFLENRWPVVGRDSGTVARVRLYAAFVRPGKVHPAAEVSPPKSHPFMLDEGEYQLRSSRLRLEMRRAGLMSFLVTFLRYRPPTDRPEYLLKPIA